MQTIREDYYKCFQYNGIGYASNTKIQVKQHYIDSNVYNGQRIWKYARFQNRHISGEIIYCRFSKCDLDLFGESDKCCGYFLVPEKDLEMLIEEIIYPIEVKLIPVQKKKDYESSEVMTGWVLVVLVCLISLIFKEWYLVWLCAFIIFFRWRNKKLLE